MTIEKAERRLHCSPIHQFGLGSAHSHTMHTSSPSSKYHSPIYCQSAPLDPSIHLAIQPHVVGDAIVEWDESASRHWLRWTGTWAIVDLQSPICVENRFQRVGGSVDEHVDNRLCWNWNREKLHREYYLLTIEVSNATASTNCVAICFGMNTKSNASNKPFLIAGRFAIISLAALCRRENSWNKFSRRGADRKLKLKWNCWRETHSLMSLRKNASNSLESTASTFMISCCWIMLSRMVRSRAMILGFGFGIGIGIQWNWCVSVSAVVGDTGGRKLAIWIL